MGGWDFALRVDGCLGIPVGVAQTISIKVLSNMRLSQAHSEFTKSAVFGVSTNQTHFKKICLAGWQH